MVASFERTTVAAFLAALLFLGACLPPLSGQVANPPAPELQAIHEALPDVPSDKVQTIEPTSTGNPIPSCGQHSRRLLLREVAELIWPYQQSQGASRLEEVTSQEVWDRLHVQLFRVVGGPLSNETFLVRDRLALPLGMAFGGRGLSSLEISDLDRDGCAELLFSYSFGSDVQQSRIGMVAPAYDPSRAFDAGFGYLGQVSLVQTRAGEMEVALVEGERCDEEACPPVTLGRLNIVHHEDEMELTLSISPVLPDSAYQRVLSRETALALEDADHVSGLVFRRSDRRGLWIVDEEGQMRQVTEHSDAKLSPDGQQVLYTQDEDIYIEHLASGRTTNLTNTPQAIERGYQWWPAHPDMIVHNTLPRDREGPSAGLLAVLDLKSGDREVLDGLNSSITPPALSPDGSTVAYDCHGIPALHRMGQGLEVIQLADYGYQARLVTSPAWSPDGRFLAWKAFGGEPDGGSWRGVIVLDLKKHSGSLLHRYSGTGGTHIEPGLAWSPNGRQLAFLAQGEFPGQARSLWVMDADGSSEHLLGTAAAAVWSPDGKWLAASGWPPGGGALDELAVSVVRIGEWIPQQMTLPEGSVVVDWIDLVALSNLHHD